MSEKKEGSLATNTFRGLHGAFIVADIARQETFHGVAKFRQIIDEKVTKQYIKEGQCVVVSTTESLPLERFFSHRLGVDGSGSVHNKHVVNFYEKSRATRKAFFNVRVCTSIDNTYDLGAWEILKLEVA